LNYSFAYSIGFHPWEDAFGQPEFSGKIAELFAREEHGLERPFGRALDVGTGSGIWGVELAKRGWEVTGIDMVRKALDRAQVRVAEASVEMTLVEGDVTSLQEAGISSGFRLILDTGTFHDFSSEQQAAMAQGINALASPDATILLLVWPRRRRPLIRGADRHEVENAFTGWHITDVEPSHFKLPAPLKLLLRPDEHWYRLRRVPEDG